MLARRGRPPTSAQVAKQPSSSRSRLVSSENCPEMSKCNGRHEKPLHLQSTIPGARGGEKGKNEKGVHALRNRLLAVQPQSLADGQSLRSQDIHHQSDLHQVMLALSFSASSAGALVTGVAPLTTRMPSRATAVIAMADDKITKGKVHGSVCACSDRAFKHHQLCHTASALSRTHACLLHLSTCVGRRIRWGLLGPARGLQGQVQYCGRLQRER